MNDLSEHHTDHMLRQSVLSSHLAMAVTDPRQSDNPLVFINPAFSELTGYASTELLGRNCRFLQGPGTDQAAKEALKCALARRRSIEVDLLNYRKTGEPFYNKLFVSPVFDHGGNLIHYFSSQLDVSAQRRADVIGRRREDILRQISVSLRERLRMTLAAVETIVGNALTEASSVTTAAGDISTKLISLGHIHNSLLKEDWDNLTIASVVESVAFSLPGLRQSLHVSGPDVRTDAHTSFRLASLIHDLCAESLQHGALGTTDGRVELCWSAEDGGSPFSIRIAWREFSNQAARRTDYLANLQRSANLRQDIKCIVQRDRINKEVLFVIDLPFNDDAASSNAET